MKCVTIGKCLLAQGHRVSITVKAGNLPFAQSLNSSIPFVVVNDLNEADHSYLPTSFWFQNAAYIRQCVESMSKAMEIFRPDKVLGVFSFTAKLAAKKCNIPFVGMTCGSMTSVFDEPMGFLPDEALARFQDKIIKTFFAYAADRVCSALEETDFAAEPVSDLRSLLEGESTLLWDFPEFQPLKTSPGMIHAGPIWWDRISPEFTFPEIDRNLPVAVISLGTRWMNRQLLKQLINILYELGYFIIQTGMEDNNGDCHPGQKGRYISYKFAPLDILLKRATLFISHGGQMSLFEALHNRVPSIIMPFQPEQAQNGICIERLKCGLRLIESTVYQQDSSVFYRALERSSKSAMIEKLELIRGDSGMEGRLIKMSHVIRQYDGVNTTIQTLTNG